LKVNNPKSVGFDPDRRNLEQVRGRYFTREGRGREGEERREGGKGRGRGRARARAREGEERREGGKGEGRGREKRGRGRRGRGVRSTHRTPRLVQTTIFQCSDNEAINHLTKYPLWPFQHTTHM
jgi:hypothetical protein